MRVGVAGALGRLGRVACAAVDAADDLDIVAGVRPRRCRRAAWPIGIGCGGERAHPRHARRVLRRRDGRRRRLHRLSGHARRRARGDRQRRLAGHRRDRLDRRRHHRARATTATSTASARMLVPNFSVGAVLMMKLAAEAARSCRTSRSSSCTTRQARRAQRHGEADRRSASPRPAVRRHVPIHSVRLPGLVAHQEVLFGGLGETLTIRHDSLVARVVRAGDRARGAQRPQAFRPDGRTRIITFSGGYHREGRGYRGNGRRRGDDPARARGTERSGRHAARRTPRASAITR